ncbi:uncharacterized protein LOC102720614 [Oryza brachyantha]|uniref:uncharacterized protein LOC102720614 n=1 Tax=Oryza brachyantha TaxID=4533 RepID=UPI001ADB8BD2|nr:uncharacterized protein LOC102720614 [Oryza brachyantha]
MASAIVPDIWQWTRGLPSPKHWRGESYSLEICNSPSTNQSLNLVVSWHSETQSFSLSYSIRAELHDPISLWSSHCSKSRSANGGSDVAVHFLHDIICGVIRYGPCFSKPLFRLPNVQASEEDSGKIFSLAALTLGLMVCVYEAPSTARRELVGAVSAQLMHADMRGAAEKLMLAMGPGMEEQWMRSLNLAATNWVMEARRSGGMSPVLPFRVFSYAVLAASRRLWKVRLYCPVVAMVVERPAHRTKDEKLLFSLNYQHLEAAIQFVYSVTFREEWIDVNVNVDSIRCELVRLVSETLMAKQGYGSDEKHFPSRISLQLRPLVQTDVLSLTLRRSTEDSPVREADMESGLDGAAPATTGIAMSAHRTATRTLGPWNSEHSVHGDTASLNWSLHGGGAEGREREAFSGEPPKLELLQPRSWFRNRCTNPGRPPATARGGGVMFAGDEHGEGACWRMGAATAGKTVEWEIKGSVWVTYCPSKRRAVHAETRRLEFREVMRLAVRE